MATTINAANISIGMDITKLKDGMGATRSEISQLRSILRDSIDPVDKLKSQIQILERAFRAGAIDVDQYTRSMDHLKKKLSEVNDRASATGIRGLFKGEIGKLAGMAAGALTVSSIFGTVQEFDAIIDKSEQLGVSYKDLMVIGRTLEESGGISFDQAGQAISKMQVNLANARDKGGDLDNALKKIGLSSRQLANMDAVTAFQTISASFSQIGGQADKMQFATQLFGKAGIDMVPALETGANKFAEMEQHLRAAGLLQEGLEGSISKAADDAAKLKDHFAGVALQLTSQVQPALTGVLKLINDSARGWQNLSVGINGVVMQGDAIDQALGITHDSKFLESLSKEQRAAYEDSIAELRAAYIRRKRTEDEIAARRKETEQDVSRMQEESARNREEAERRIAAMRDDAFKRGESEFERMQRATMGDAEFERRQITNPNFQMTDAERLQAAETLDNMAETRRQNAMRQTREEVEASQKRLRDEAKIAEMRQQGILSSDEDRRKAVEVQNRLDEQRKAEQQRLNERIAEIKRQTADRPDLQEKAIERAKKESEARMKELKQTADAAMDQVNVENRLGFLDKQKSTLEAERQRIMGASGPNVAATIAPAIKAGTVEAYKAVNQQNEQRAARAEQIAELKRINESLARLANERNVILTRFR